MDPELEEMRNAVLNRVGTSRNGSHSNGKPKPKSARFDIFNKFVDLHASSLPPLHSLVWMTLWRFVDARSGTVTISHNGLARVTGLSRRSIYTATDNLNKQGYLRVVKQGGPNHQSNVYRLTLKPIVD